MKPLPKRKILFVITKSNWGGAQRYVYDLATHLPKEQFDVSVAFGGTGAPGAPDGLLAQRLKEAGIRTHFITLFSRDVSVLRDYKSFLELVRLITKEQPDVLHVNSSKAGGLGALAGRIAGIKKIIFTAHGFAHNEIRSWYERVFIWLASWCTILCTHKTIVLSNYELEHAPIIFSRKKLVVIHTGIDVNMQFASGEKIRSLFPAGAHITGTIGELTRNKNQITLIEEARHTPGMHVAIVGEGEDREYLQKKIQEYGLQDRIKLLGFMPAHEVLRGFDMFALPSLKEGLPYVLLEAKAAGLPIVANYVGGVREILETKSMEEFSLEQMLKKTVSIYLS